MPAFSPHYAGWFERHVPQLPPAMAVAVSGGADSVALLLTLHSFAKEKGIALTALTVDHGLRPESRAEAEWVATLCATHHIPHTILTWQKDALPKAGLQAQAREARLALMAEYCLAHNIRHLALAHHLNDMAETVTMRLARGAGVDGLSGIPPVSEFGGISLLHPLLSFPKAVLVNVLQQRGQSWCEDPSNHSPSYARNRIRKGLELAGLEPEPIATTARNMARVSDFLQQETQKAIDAALTLHPLGYISLNRAVYNGLHPEIRLRLLRHVFMCMNNGEVPRMDELEHLHQHLSHKHTLAKTVIACKGDAILFFREMRHLPPPAPFAEGVWDGRFTLRGSSPFMLAPLGKEGVHFLKEQGVPLPPVPAKEILYALPALWHLENLVSAPHIEWEDASFPPCRWGSVAFNKGGA